MDPLEQSALDEAANQHAENSKSKMDKNKDGTVDLEELKSQLSSEEEGGHGQGKDFQIPHASYLRQAMLDAHDEL